MATKDMILLIAGLGIDFYVHSARAPFPGESLRSTSFDTVPGGKGLNCAVACARLLRPRPPQYCNTAEHHSDPDYKIDSGLEVKIIGPIGDDSFAAKSLAGLRRNGVDIGNVVVKEGVATQIALVMIEDDKGENRILTVPGANYAMTPEDIPRLPTPIPKIFIINLEIPMDTALYALRLGSQAGSQVIFNPSPTPSGPLPAEFYESMTDLIMNEVEAEALSNIGQGGKLVQDQLLETAMGFLKQGVRTVVITLGGDGYFYATKKGSEYGQEMAVPVSKVIDVTAAGDSFIGAYAVAMIQGASVKMAASWANKCAAKAVQIDGACESVPWLDEVPKLEKLG